MAGTVFIAAGAFWLSFTSLADLAARSGIGESQAWAWPLIVDGIIVVATVAVVALAGQRSAWYPWALLTGGALVSVTANALHAVVAADADVPRVLAASVAAVPPVVLLAITHLTVILVRTVDAELPAGRPVLSAGGMLSPEPLSGQHPVSPDSVPVVSIPPRPLVGVTGLALGSLDGEEQRNRRSQAKEWRDAGWSNKRIARELGVHPSTVGRWFATAHLPYTADSAVVREETTP